MLDYNLLMKEVSDVKKCYFIYSYDGKLVKNFIRSIENILVLRDFKEFNYVNMKYEVGFDINKFFEVCNTMPVMQEKKLVVVENALFLRSDYDNKELVKVLKEYLKQVPEYCTIVFYYVFKNQDKNKDNLKAFAEFGEVCKILEFKGEDFCKEVSKLFVKYKLHIKPSLIEYFCQRINNDFFHIENEIIKLKSFVYDGEVTKQHIDDIVPASLENNVFVFINNVLDKNLKKSITTFRELINSGNDFNYIFSMLSNQFVKFLDVKLLIEEGLNSNEIVNKTKMNRYVVSNFIKLSQRYNLREIVRIIDSFLNLEYKLRSINEFDPFSELEILIISICK